MPAAANLTGLKPAAPEVAPGAAPGAAELFAALVAAIGPGAETPAVAPEAEAEAGAEGEQPAADAAVVDASILLPMLDQQRAAAPAAIAIAIPAASTVKAAETADSPPVASGERPAAPANNPVAPAPGEKALAALSTEADAGRTAAKAFAGAVPEKASAEAVSGKASATEAPARDVRPATTDPHRPGAPATPAPSAGLEGPAAPPRITLPPAATAPAQPNIPAQGVAAVLANPPATPMQAMKSVRPTSASRVADAAVPSVATAPTIAPAPLPAAPAVAASPLPVALEQGAAELATAPQNGRDAAPSAPIQPLPSSPLTMASAAPAQAPVQNLGAALANQVLDLSRGGEWVDQLARDIARSAASDGTMRFRLAPETLGELRVEITQNERGAHVRLHVTSEAAQQALAEASPKLVQEARAQGVRIAEAEVSLSGGQGQGREPGRQAPSEQPLRGLRNPAPNDFTGSERSGDARPGRTDLYA